MEGNIKEKSTKTNKSESMLQFKTGDLSNLGDKIERILVQDDHYIIYINELKNLCWEIPSPEEWQKPGITEANRLRVYAYTNVSKQHHPSINLLLGTALASILRSSQEDDFRSKFKDTYVFIEEKKKEIEEIYAETPNWAIYLRTDGSVEYWYPDLPDRLFSVPSEFYRLSSLASTALPKNHRNCASIQLASALAGAFRAKQNADVNEGFKAVKKFIVARIESRYKLYFLLASTISTALGLALIVILNKLLSNAFSSLSYSLGVGAGMTGAFLSTLQRTKDLNINPLIPPMGVILQGITRIAIGLIFGLFIVGAAKSGLVLGTFSDNLNALAVLSFIGGFSERYVPNLIDKIADKTEIINKRWKEKKNSKQ